MSYIVTIRRPEGTLTSEDLAQLVARDDSLMLMHAPSSAEIVGLEWVHGTGTESFGFCFDNGVLDSSTTPDDAALEKMQEIATALGARLVGEEGEDITEALVAAGDTSGSGCTLFITLLGIAVFLTLYWAAR